MPRVRQERAARRGSLRALVGQFDGGCRYGVCGAGAAVLFDSGGEQIASRATYMAGELVTTNLAEYAGLVNALSLAREDVLREGLAAVKVLGDSEVVVRQVRGIYQCRKAHLRPWLDHALALIGELKAGGSTVAVELFPRAGPQNRRRFGNHTADALATACMKAERDLP